MVAVLIFIFSFELIIVTIASPKMCFDNTLRDSKESVSFATKCTTISTTTLD